MTCKKHIFTLIELLVILSILVFMTALLFPALSRVKEISEISECKDNLRHLGAGAIQYSGDNCGYLPVVRAQYYWPGGAIIHNAGWKYELFPYVGDPYADTDDIQTFIWGVYACPKVERNYTPPVTWPERRDESFRGGYGWNGGYLGDDGFRYSRKRRTDVKFPELTFMMGDNSDSATGSDKLRLYGPSRGLDKVAVRHEEGGNYAYADGHADWMSYEDVISQSPLNYYYMNGKK